MRDRNLASLTCRKDAEVDLYVLPPAGAGASIFARWAPATPPLLDVVAVRPPGREGRIREEVPSTLTDLCQPLASAIVEHSGDRPFGILGHSFGAVAAFVLCQLLPDTHVPRVVAVSGARAPHLSGHGDWADVDDEQLMRELCRHRPELAAAFAGHPDLLSMFLPTVRADLSLLRRERGRFATIRPREVALLAIAGDKDDVAPAEDVAAWASWTTTSFEMATFPGGHFFLFDRPAETAEKVAASLLALV